MRVERAYRAAEAMAARAEEAARRSVWPPVPVDWHVAAAAAEREAVARRERERGRVGSPARQVGELGSTDLLCVGTKTAQTAQAEPLRRRNGWASRAGPMCSGSPGGLGRCQQYKHLCRRAARSTRLLCRFVFLVFVAQWCVVYPHGVDSAAAEVAGEGREGGARGPRSSDTEREKK